MASPIFTPTCSLFHVAPSDVPLPPISSVCSPFPLSLRSPLASLFSMIQLPLCTLIFNGVSFFELAFVCDAGKDARQDAATTYPYAVCC